MNIFDSSSCVGVVVGAVGGGWLGHSWFGAIGFALGVPIGAIALAFVLPQLVWAAFMVGIVWEKFRSVGGTKSDRSGQPTSQGPDAERG